MIKSTFAAVAALSVVAAPAMAGPYVNIEANSGWVGSDYSGTVIDNHVGYEGALGESSSWYVQGGPAIVAVDGEDSELELSGKAGLGVDLTESLSAYGEVSFLTGDDDNGYGGKLGVTYKF
jgi:outer membrane autotransporter protein